MALTNNDISKLKTIFATKEDLDMVNNHLEANIKGLRVEFERFRVEEIAPMKDDLAKILRILQNEHIILSRHVAKSMERIEILRQDLTQHKLE